MKRFLFLTIAGFMAVASCSGGEPTPNSAAADENAAASVVYFTKEITPEALVRIYKALGVDATGRVAVKISTGESSKSNHLRPELIKDLVQSVGGTLVECNTAYGGNRATTAEPLRSAVSVALQMLILWSRKARWNCL